MKFKFDIGKYRILLIAAFLSLAAHAFWLSVLKIDISGTRTDPAQFSKVSCLGPVLDTGALELGISPRSSSFLEKRYMEGIRPSSYEAEGRTTDAYAMDGAGKYFCSSGEKAIMSGIGGVMGESKPQPPSADDH